MYKLILIILLSSYAFADLMNFDRAKKDYDSLKARKYSLLPHNGTYLIPFSYNQNPNNRPFDKTIDGEQLNDQGDFVQKEEAEIQISFLIITNENFLNSGFDTFIGYTHRAWWQIYNSKWSRPFRETNYTPELFARKVFSKPKRILGGHWLAYDFGYMHQSNGQIQGLSRSWDRLFIRTAFLFDQLLVKISLWHEIIEKRSEDDNPDLYKYLGYGELDLTYKYESHNYSIKYIPGIEDQGFQLKASFPWKEGLRYYMQIDHGYGTSLLDYDNYSQRIGIGFIMSDPFTAN